MNKVENIIKRLEEEWVENVIILYTRNYKIIFDCYPTLFRFEYNVMNKKILLTYGIKDEYEGNSDKNFNVYELLFYIMNRYKHEVKFYGNIEMSTNDFNENMKPFIDSKKRDDIISDILK